MTRKRQGVPTQSSNIVNLMVTVHVSEYNDASRFGVDKPKPQVTMAQIEYILKETLFREVRLNRLGNISAGGYALHVVPLSVKAKNMKPYP